MKRRQVQEPVGNAEVVRLLEAIEKHGAVTAEAILDQLKVIRNLSDTNMTSALRAELAAMIKEAVLTREMMEMKREQGTEPTTEAKQTLRATDAAIIGKRAELSDHLDATAEEAEAQDNAD